MSQSGLVPSTPAARRGLCMGGACLALLALCGCSTNEREQYFGARQRVITVRAGDSSAIVSRVYQTSTVARAQRTSP